MKLRKKILQTCSNCGEKILRTLMKKHTDDCRKEDRTGIFKCSAPQCHHKRFMTQNILKQHIKRVHDTPIKCQVGNCDTIMKENSLARHMKIVHEKIKRECSNCGKRVIYCSLTRHMKSCTSGGSRPFRCGEEGCDQSFRTSADRSCHISSVHRAPVKNTIENCGDMFQKVHQAIHDKSIHQESREKCPKPGKELIYNMFSKQQKSCISDIPSRFTCQKKDCEMIFETARAKFMHEQIVHGAVVCPILNCGALIRKIDLSRHLKQLHEQLENEFINSVGKVVHFSLPENRKAHMSDESSIPLTIDQDGCEMTFETTHESHTREDSDQELETTQVHNETNYNHNVQSEPIHYVVLESYTDVIKKAHLVPQTKVVHKKMKEKCGYCGMEIIYRNLYMHLKTCTGR